MDTRSICICDRTFFTFTGRRMTSFVNFALNLRHSDLLFISWRIFLSLNPVYERQTPSQIFFAPKDLHSINVLLTTHLTSNFFRTYVKIFTLSNHNYCKLSQLIPCSFFCAVETLPDTICFLSVTLKYTSKVFETTVK